MTVPLVFPQPVDTAPTIPALRDFLFGDESCFQQQLEEKCGSDVYDLAWSRNQTGDVDSQAPFRHGRNIYKLDSHPFPIFYVADDSIQRDVLAAGVQCKSEFGPNRKRIRVGDKNALQA